MEPGDKLGRYEILARLGAGGMGEVFRARDTLLHRIVAVKIVRTPSGRGNRRLLLEARAASALNHPNIAAVYDISQSSGVDFIVMEYVAGTPLNDVTPPEGLPLDRLISYGVQIADGLSAAHAAGVIHRDIKPANIVVTETGGIKVLDFGIANLTRRKAPPGDPEETVTQLEVCPPGAIVGTLAYMSPEQARGEPLDARSDLFSLGSVLYGLATGRPPFSGPSALAIMHEIAAVEPPLPSSVREDLPTDLDEVVMRALRKDKADRYASAAELAHALRSIRLDPAPKSSVAAGQRRRTFLVGREAESARLRNLFDDRVKRDGEGTVALVLGEPGVGKSTLLDSFLESVISAAPKALIGRGACVEQFGIREPYLPFLDAVGRLLSSSHRETVQPFLERYAPTWCLQFPGLLSRTALSQLEKDTIGATKERMLREFADVMEKIGAATPVLLLIEDLHWADSSSIDLLLHIGRRLSGSRVMVLGTARPQANERHSPLENCKRELGTHGSYTEIPLGLLSQDEVSRYVAERLTPNDFPPELGEMVYRRCAGLPLFIAGVFQILVERGDVRLENKRWRLAKDLKELELDVPESVRGMIAKKLEALDEVDYATLECASVLGEEFPTTVVTALIDGDELHVEGSLERIRRAHRLITASGEIQFPDGSIGTRYRFAHTLYQNALYGDIAPGRKAALHRKAAEALAALHPGDNSRIAGTLALHFERGRDYRAAAEQCIVAGNNALALYATPQAIGYYTHALELLTRLPANERFEREVTARYKRSQAYLSARMLDESMRDCDAVITIAREAAREDWACRALTSLGLIHNYARQPERMSACAGEALAIASRIGDVSLEAEAKALLANSRMVIGDLGEARILFGQAIERARSLQHVPALLQGLTYGGVARFFQSEYAEAERLEAEAAAVAAGSRDGFYLALSLFYLGLSRANQGKIGAAFQALSEALELAKRNGNQIALSRVPNGIGWLWREMGDMRQAIEFNQLCVETARKTKAAEAEANALINLVYDYLAVSQPSNALDALTQVKPLFERERWNQWRFFGVRYHAARAEYFLAERMLDHAQSCAEALLRNARHYGVPKYIAVANRLLGEAAEMDGRLADAEDRLTASLDALRLHPAPLTEWRILAVYGRVLARAGRRAAARERCVEASMVIQTIAGTIPDPAAISSFERQPLVKQIVGEAAGAI